MLSQVMPLRQKFGRLSRLNKVFVIALILRVGLSVIEAAVGGRLPGSGLFRFLFVVIAILFLVRSFPRMVRKLLWRVRHRLLVTWVFLGVVPIVLIAALVLQGLYIIMGQVVGYMTTAELDRQNQLVRGTAETLSWRVADRVGSATIPAVIEPLLKEISQSRHAEVRAVVQTGTAIQTVPPNGPITKHPEWFRPGFAGLLIQDGTYYLGAYHELKASSGKTAVFLYQRVSDEFFANLLPRVAATSLLDVDVRANVAGVSIERTERRGSGIRFNAGPADDDPDLSPPPAPDGRGWWDIPVSWLVPFESFSLADGKPDASLVIVASRPSLIIGKLFSSLGDFAAVPFLWMAAIGIVLLFVEVVSLIFGATLTRSITRSVSDLYQGTRKVQEGDFSHRIPIRTKDQLGELAGSFNTMTERIQGLIVEAKEKERLENELTIARDVQSQLFPREFPKLKTLELWGGCKPARSVSGDYYDFVPLGAGCAALAIGDVSGKGISAALLMAHIQSALRSQLMHQTNFGKDEGANGIISPSSIISILNDHLYGSSPSEKYATFFLGLYSDESGQMVYTNAGHLPPILVRSRQVLRLPGDGFPVGMFPGIQYDRQAMRLEPGDLFVAFTDGVTEAENPGGEEFADRRLGDLIVRVSDRPLEEIAGEIHESLEDWTGHLDRHDDTTLILARRL